MTHDGNTVTARAHPNIAFIKYWGNRDHTLRLPANSSLSMNLDGLYTQTAVTWSSGLEQDELILNGQPDYSHALKRVVTHLDNLRERLGIAGHAHVESLNNFPMGTGIASSASSFAALTLAATTAAGLQLSERELSTAARLGSGSAARSIPTGFVEWHSSDSHEDSFAESIAAPDYWELVDVVAIVGEGHKAVGSTEGHQSAMTSDLQAARVVGTETRLEVCKKAIREHDFETFAEVVELDSNLMHAVMMTSRPPLFYWQPASLFIMERVRQWRAEGLHVCYTLDAGPNVHCICLRNDAETVSERLKTLSGVLEIRMAGAGGPAQILDVSNL